jgi:hypothetical protein
MISQAHTEEDAQTHLAVLTACSLKLLHSLLDTKPDLSIVAVQVTAIEVVTGTIQHHLPATSLENPTKTPVLLNTFLI